MQASLLAFNADEGAVLRLVLQRAGLAARITADLEEASRDWPNQNSDLLVLAFRRDVPIPFVRQLRARIAVPLVVISEPLSEDSRIDLLESGADLVISRPYSGRLLIAEIRALLRRTAGVPFFSLPTISRGEITLDPSERTVQIGQLPSRRLTQLEFRLLYTLILHPDQVFPAETLVEHVWGYSGRGDRDLVRGLIRRLRSKIEPNPKSPRFIQTVPRVGYVFKVQS
jgi:DNA-binding response OmpR family regulator